MITPGRYVGIKQEVGSSEEEFEKKVTRLTERLSGQFQKDKQLKKDIQKNLEELGYNGI